jgi:ribosomal-protein-alanine N-acetyltransferase
MTLPKLPTLRTDRLILRSLTLDDTPSIFAYASDPEVSRYTLWEPHKTLNDALSFIQDYAFKRYAEGHPEPFGIAFKTDPDTIIGTIGCFWVSPRNRSMELAYAIGRQYWGQGIIVEAGQVLLKHVFTQFDIERLQCRCKVENVASARVMEKLGFQKEGVLRSEVFHRNIFWDMHYTSLLRHEFLARNS